MSKITILKEKISKKRCESFWYHDEAIAEAVTASGKRFLAEARGEIQVQLEKNGTRFRGSDAVTEAYNLKLKDKDIQKLLNKDRFIFNNWFVVIELNNDGTYFEGSDDLDIQGDYDSIIESLKNISEE